MLRWQCCPHRSCCLKALQRQWPYFGLPVGKERAGAHSCAEAAVGEAEKRIYPDCRIV